MIPPVSAPYGWRKDPDLPAIEDVEKSRDDLNQIAAIAGQTELELLGYLCPTPAVAWADDPSASEGQMSAVTVSDGGRGMGDVERPGGLSRLEDILVEQDADTVVLAFAEADSAEFFGALDACYEHGVAAKDHRDHADTG